jgi:hypothetical protein
MEVTKNKDTESLPLHRVCILAPFTSLLKDVGAPVEAEFSKANLPWFALEDDNNYVPSRNFYKFILNSAHSEGIPDLGFRAGVKRTLLGRLIQKIRRQECATIADDQFDRTPI